MEKYPYYPQMWLWVAFLGTELVGLIAGTVDEDTYVMWDLFVAPDFQRRGVGRALVKTSIRESGCSKVHAEVRDNNIASQALLSSLGFAKKYSASVYELQLPPEKPG
jgi:ribosomal protein S18 acetylase RimI-like enzyme